MTTRAACALLLMGCGVIVEGDPQADLGLDEPIDAAPADAQRRPDAAQCDPAPPEVRIREAPVGEITVVAVPLGCGDGVLVHAIELVNESLPDALHVAEPVEPGRVDHVRITYTPRRVAERALGTLVVHTDLGRIDVPVAASSRWSDLACRHWDAEIVAGPADGTLLLDARPPAGVARTAAQVSWVVMARPAGSRSRPTETWGGEAPDDPDTPNAWFVVDQRGTYDFECTIKFPAASGCQPQRTVLRVRVCPCEDDLRAEISWRAPSGAVTDLDLHLLHPDAAVWEAPGLDAHPGDPDPRWSQVRVADRRPVHSGDDAALTGSEWVTLAFAEGIDTLEGLYRVGVQSHAAEPVDVTVRVYLLARLVLQAERRLRPEAPFWDVTGVGWSAPVGDSAPELVPVAWDRVLPLEDGQLPDPNTPLPLGSACLTSQPPCVAPLHCQVNAGALVGTCTR